MPQMLFAFQRLLTSHPHDQVSWHLSNSGVHEDCWGERDKIQTKPRKKGIAAATGESLGIQGQPLEPKTHLFPGDRGPHSRAACSPWWNQDEWHLLTGTFWQGAGLWSPRPWLVVLPMMSLSLIVSPGAGDSPSSPFHSLYRFG